MDELLHLFIDESGKAELTDNKYQNFLLTGIWLTTKDLATTSGYFSFIKRRYGLPLDVPFHTYDLIEDPKKKLSAVQIPKFVNSMAEFIETVPFNSFLILTKKTKFIKDFKIDVKNLESLNNRIIYRLSLMYLLQEFSLNLEKNNLNSAIHVDSRKYLDTELIKAYNDIKEKTYKGTKNEIVEAAKRLCSIEFASKTALSSGLELADFISFVAYSGIERRLSELGMSKVWKVIKIKFKQNPISKLPVSFAEQFIDK